MTDGKFIHSFGGHSGSITCVRFGSMKSYLNMLNESKINNEQNDENDSNELAIDNSEQEDSDEENDKIKPKKNDVRKTYPFVLSSSLDCSLRIWSIYKGRI